MMSPNQPLPLATASILAKTHPHEEASDACRRLRIIARRRAFRLPDDDTRLARWARLSPSAWRRIKPAVMTGWTLADGRWTPMRPTGARESAGTRADVALEDPARPRTAEAADLVAIAGPHGTEAIAVLTAIMEDPTAPPGARLAAARTLLDRGFGKPARPAKAEPQANPQHLVIRRIIVEPDGRETSGDRP